MKRNSMVLVITISVVLTVLPACRKKDSNITPPSTGSVSNNTAITAALNQIELLSTELKELKAKEKAREEMVQRLLKLNEEVRRERATNIITVPVTVIVTNSPPSAQQPVPTNKAVKPVKKPLSPKSQTTKTRVPMYVITNSTSSVTVTGTNTVSETHTSVQNYLPPGRRSLLGVILGGRANPISTTVPSGQSVQQGEPPTPVVVVQQPYGYGYGGYGYGGYGYGYPYSRVPAYSQSCERRLFGVRFHAR